MPELPDINIIAFRPSLAPDFARLNKSWLQKYFEVEPIDAEMLSKPQQYYLEDGGAIFFARIGTDIAGTYALIRKSDCQYELSKMAVDEKFQGRQVGHRLLEHAIAFAKSIGAEKIILFSHTRLQSAIHLYRKYGFVEIPIGDSAYKRSDIKMEKIL
ncbi:GNAT family N-acetyltransferase [Flavihumibacter profundi]|uniref:GNAT family N-acetyltransferase n=1 Tax=Flavihumibacter profundi TaxID=2716883 RepID=UPI001CC725EF|nr:GNAT family N-acetyltransferase [Flavihumibacter profundi]MBZ5856633.1 GNAT family N-acetyltransferase [Flavihumibacter profundi]